MKNQLEMQINLLLDCQYSSSFYPANKFPYLIDTFFDFHINIPASNWTSEMTGT